MNNFMNPLIDNAVQCWGCPVFDRLFQIVSNAAAAVYQQFSFFCIILFCVMFAFFVLNAFWKNMRNDMKDPWYAGSVQKVFINAVVALGLLGMGVALPRFVTTITFEPAAKIALTYTQAMVQQDTKTIEEHVTYQPMEMGDNGFYTPQLRDTIVLLMQTTITQFQSYMKLGIAVIDSAFSWDALLGIGALIKHIILAIIGVYLFYKFFQLFARFCFYFADIIVAMTFFAFFFPFSLVMMAFNGASDVPGWMSNLGKSLGVGQFKKLINAIVALSAAVITYTVIMVVIAKFFASNDMTTDELMTLIMRGDVFAADLSTDNLAAMTLGGCIVLIYVVDFLYKEIPNVTKMILNAFGVGTENKLSEELATNAMNFTKTAVDLVKKAGKTIISGGETKDEGKK